MEKVSADIFTFQHPCRKCCLTIAGSDSGGNAGVQADLRAFHYYGRHGCTVFAALTAQNPFGVSAIHAVPADFVAAQLDAVLGVYDIGAVKTGMLADPAAIEVIADRLAKHPEIAKVIDPVMVATSGVRLVSEETVEKIKGLLLPLATLITPNLPEAEVLLGNAVDDPNAERLASAEHAAELAQRLRGIRRFRIRIGRRMDPECRRVARKDLAGARKQLLLQKAQRTRAFVRSRSGQITHLPWQLMRVQTLNQIMHAAALRQEYTPVRRLLRVHHHGHRDARAYRHRFAQKVAHG